MQVCYLMSFYLFEYLTNLKVKFWNVLKISQLQMWSHVLNQ